MKKGRMEDRKRGRKEERKKGREEVNVDIKKNKVQAISKFVEQNYNL